MKLYFVRHSESQANRQHEFSNTGWKHPLTEAGRAQARALAERLSGVRAARIYASPLQRALQTAEILAERLAAPLETHPALREWSVGDYEGRRDPAGWELHRQVQADWFERGQLDSKMPGGESLLEIEARFRPFIASLIQTAQNADRALVLVAHGGLYLAMLPRLLRNLPGAVAREHGFPYTGCVVAEAQPDGLVCREWCGTLFEA